MSSRFLLFILIFTRLSSTTIEAQVEYMGHPDVGIVFAIDGEDDELFALTHQAVYKRKNANESWKVCIPLTKINQALPAGQYITEMYIRDAKVFLLVKNNGNNSLMYFSNEGKFLGMLTLPNQYSNLKITNTTIEYVSDQKLISVLFSGNAVFSYYLAFDYDKKYDLTSISGKRYTLLDRHICEVETAGNSLKISGKLKRIDDQVLVKQTIIYGRYVWMWIQKERMHYIYRFDPEYNTLKEVYSFDGSDVSQQTFMFATSKGICSTSKQGGVLIKSDVSGEHWTKSHNIVGEYARYLDDKLFFCEQYQLFSQSKNDPVFRLYNEGMFSLLSKENIKIIPPTIKRKTYVKIKHGYSYFKLPNFELFDINEFFDKFDIAFDPNNNCFLLNNGKVYFYNAGSKQIKEITLPDQVTEINDIKTIGWVLFVQSGKNVYFSNPSASNKDWDKIPFVMDEYSLDYLFDFDYSFDYSFNYLYAGSEGIQSSKNLTDWRDITYNFDLKSGNIVTATYLVDKYYIVSKYPSNALWVLDEVQEKWKRIALPYINISVASIGALGNEGAYVLDNKGDLYISDRDLKWNLEYSLNQEILYSSSSDRALIFTSTLSGIYCFPKADLIRKLTNANVVSNENLTIFPNPGSDIVQLNFDKKPEFIKVLDAMSNVLDIKYPESESYQLNISHLPAGTYFINIKQGKDSFNKKIIKID
jgi:hypothetical protein